MRKFEKKINELGLEKGKLSKSLNEFVRNFELAEDELKGLRIDLKQAEQEEDNDEEIDKLLAKIEELENDLEQADNELSRKVELHHKNGDFYAARAQKMREAREAKAASKKNNTQVSTEAAITNSNDTNKAQKQEEPPIPQPQPQPQPQPKQEEEPIKTNEEPKDEKGTNWLLWGVLGVAGIFVGINLFKNKR